EELRTGQGSNRLTRRSSAIPHAKNIRQFVDRETERERRTDHLNPSERRGRILTVAVLAAARCRQEPLPPVVAKRVWTYAGRTGQLADPDCGNPLLHRRHYARWNAFQGQAQSGWPSVDVSDSEPIALILRLRCCAALLPWGVTRATARDFETI